MSIFQNEIINSLKILNNGGTILYPTDTIWGIGCDATNVSAIKKIYTLKNREEKKSMIILVSDAGMIAEYVSAPSQKILSFLSAQIKPTTAIFENAINLPTQLVNQNGSIAIRIVKDIFCQQLIAQLRKPLVSTSANISGAAYPQNFKEISDEIKNGVDYMVQHRREDLPAASPSSIIKLDTKGEIEIIR
ncbi:MAG: L-threonylcarbamoyladenylate synthase [Bacteroidota bacterium]|nr:L-threonylcarbamoyladenylate synthase [Bacteroidota bacterium]